MARIFSLLFTICVLIGLVSPAAAQTETCGFNSTRVNPVIREVGSVMGFMHVDYSTGLWSWTDVNGQQYPISSRWSAARIMPNWKYGYIYVNDFPYAEIRLWLLPEYPDLIFALVYNHLVEDRVAHNTAEGRPDDDGWHPCVAVVLRGA